jgi:hypothetical protein
MKTKKVIEIPFDEDGNQLHYPYFFPTVKEWKNNTEFIDNLIFMNFCRGRSAAYAELKSKTSGKKYTMFLSDLENCFENFKNGEIKGLFTFCKKRIELRN